MSHNKYWCDRNDNKLFENFNRKRNFNLSCTSVSNYFMERCSDGGHSKPFWQTIGPFMSSKGENHNEIILCEDDVIITEPRKVG